MDSIWSTRRYAPVTVDIDLLTLKGKKILKAASEKTKKSKSLQQQPHQHQQQQPQQEQQEQEQEADIRQHLPTHSNPHRHLQMDPSEGEPLKQGGELPNIAP